MAVVEWDDLEHVAGKPLTDGSQVLHETIEIGEEYGVSKDTTAYLERLDDATMGIRVAGWESFELFVTAFQESLMDGALDDYGAIFHNHHVMSYTMDYEQLPMRSRVISSVRYFAPAENVTGPLERYFDVLKRQIEEAGGVKPVAGWSADPGHEGNEALLVCGWDSAEQHKAFFGADYQAKVKKTVPQIDRVSEVYARRLDLSHHGDEE